MFASVLDAPLGQEMSPYCEHVVPGDFSTSSFIAVVCAVGEPVAHSAGLDAAAPEAALEAAAAGALVVVAAGLVLAVRALPLAVAPHARGQAAPLGGAGKVLLWTASVGRASRLVFRVRTVVLEVAEGVGGDAVAGGASPLSLGTLVALCREGNFISDKIS